jgi:hypothetical protein
MKVKRMRDFDKFEDFKKGQFVCRAEMALLYDNIGWVDIK